MSYSVHLDTRACVYGLASWADENLLFCLVNVSELCRHTVFVKMIDVRNKVDEIKREQLKSSYPSMIIFA